MPVILFYLASMLAAAFGAVLVLSKLEREVVSPVVEDARKLLDPLTNPGLLLLAVAGIFMFTRARR